MVLGLIWLAPVTSAGAAQDCTAPRDFLAMPLPVTAADPLIVALTLAYPGLEVAAGEVRFSDGRKLPLGGDRGLPPDQKLLNPSIAEQFVYLYPLDFDLEARQTPWFDPGRARNDAFFRTLYFDRIEAAAPTMTRVSHQGQRAAATFVVTTKHCVSVQLAAALHEIEQLGPAMDRYFAKVGGGFNWRRIAGTDRLSAHSFGIAVDFDTELGGYWRWSGRAEGAAGDYRNRYPAELVQAMERRGFIWGGKWHHFDGMHFEYRPEIILFARLTALMGQ